MSEHPSVAPDPARLTGQSALSSDTECIHVIDDDEAVRDSLAWLLEGNGYLVKPYADAESFLQFWQTRPLSAARGCILLDVRMPGLSGLELQERLRRAGNAMPIVFITGHGDIPMAVSTIKKGALDFIEKPFRDSHLFEVVRQALERSRELSARGESHRDSLQRVGRLSHRERQVLQLIVAGRLNKQIADDLKISIKTVEAHRANIMFKLEVRSMADLMKIVLTAPAPA